MASTRLLGRSYAFRRSCIVLLSGCHVLCLPGAPPDIHNSPPMFVTLRTGVFAKSEQSGLQGIYFSSLRFKLSSASSTSHLGANSILLAMWCAPALPRGVRAFLWEGFGAGRSCPKAAPTPCLSKLSDSFLCTPRPRGANSNGGSVYGWGVAEPGKAIDAAQRPRRLSHSR